MKIGGSRKLQRGVGLSKFLSFVFIPFCLWGLISSLLLHLIEVRSLFIAGGENRLRIATLAFALGVILIQRLHKIQGGDSSRPYAFALGAAITLFSFHNAYVYRLPAPWPLVFVVNVILFSILAWAGWKLASACSIDSEMELQAAGETGILPKFLTLKRRKKVEEEQANLEHTWVERLPKQHPGRVILYFSLFALPAFGLGGYLFDLEGEAGLRLGALLFAYLWCALALLFLSSLSQVRTYFEKRKVSLPEEIGLTWLSIGFFAVTAVLIVAYFLPQPESIPALFVRDRVTSAYRGWESESGLKDGASSEPRAGGQTREGGAPGAQDGGDTPVAGRPDPHAGDEYMHEVRQFEQGYANNYKELRNDASESFKKLVDVTVKILLILGGIFGLIVLYALIMSFWRGMSEGMGGVVWRREKKKQKPKRRRKKGEPAPEAARFRQYANPFIGSYSMSDGNEIVRHLWNALLAFCADAGSPCPPDRTPQEFLETKPDALVGFEKEAEFIAGLFTYSEFSGQPIGEDQIPLLKQFWKGLEQHAQAAL